VAQGFAAVIRLLNPTALSSAEKLFVCAAVDLSGYSQTRKWVVDRSGKPQRHPKSNSRSSFSTLDLASSWPELRYNFASPAARRGKPRLYGEVCF
jgi:hypothetical protein